MRAELEMLGVSTEDIQGVTTAPTLAEAQARLDELKRRARRRYEQLAVALHPEQTDHDPAKTQQFREVTAVYEVLMELRPMQRRPEPLGLTHGVTVRYGSTSTLSARAQGSRDGIGWVDLTAY